MKIEKAVKEILSNYGIRHCSVADGSITSKEFNVYQDKAVSAILGLIKGEEKKLEEILTQLLTWQDKDTPLELKVEWGRESILRLIEEANHGN